MSMTTASAQSCANEVGRPMGKDKGTHWNVVVFPSFVRGGYVGQVLDDLFGVFRLACTWFTPVLRHKKVTDTDTFQHTKNIFHILRDRSLVCPSKTLFLLKKKKIIIKRGGTKVWGWKKRGSAMQCWGCGRGLAESLCICLLCWVWVSSCGFGSGGGGVRGEGAVNHWVWGDDSSSRGRVRRQAQSLWLTLGVNALSIPMVTQSAVVSAPHLALWSSAFLYTNLLTYSSLVLLMWEQWALGPVQCQAHSNLFILYCF